MQYAGVETNQRRLYDRGRQRRLQKICAAYPSVILFLSTLTLPLSKSARQVRWEKQRMIERAEEGQEDSLNKNREILATLVTLLGIAETN